MLGINQKNKLRALEAALNHSNNSEEKRPPDSEPATAFLHTPPQNAFVSQALGQSSWPCNNSPLTTIDVEDSLWEDGGMHLAQPPMEPVETMSCDQTPLHLALIARKNSMVRSLLEKGANPMKRDSNGLTALHFAAQSSQIDMVKVVMEGFADLNVRDATGQTALFYAVRSGKEDIVRILLDASVDINCKDIWGKAALHYVAEYGFDSIAHLLLEYGAEIDA